MRWYFVRCFTEANLSCVFFNKLTKFIFWHAYPDSRDPALCGHQTITSMHKYARGYGFNIIAIINIFDIRIIQWQNFSAHKIIVLFLQRIHYSCWISISCVTPINKFCAEYHIISRPEYWVRIFSSHAWYKQFIVGIHNFFCTMNCRNHAFPIRVSIYHFGILICAIDNICALHGSFSRYFWCGPTTFDIFNNIRRIIFFDI